ncbi:phosphate/phosphite/phosphonate ABC transporter substrate-binding protein [Pseudomonas sp. LP_7_YM]|uniref:phosphate/phosphite/phosphonate ABC transporter substrate-binding protein n=1 Tax=Pseudomonas sp. LP_7_YM TaxID=2485137 RepID=UPI00105EB632|nr:PhnD/SsuA/transferrin family substrate-binding protein [Pseudomonas sp. LP_7_YM]TDV70265.1 ABC-type phosphate/phosphonate transport system substrate-binding protein [Pseudomonas sp. LP_7_YM]
MAQGYAELLMYLAPERVRQAQERWLNRVLELLGTERLDAQAMELKQLWLSAQLLLTQTCGYPLMTLLRGQVQIVGRPVYQLPNSGDGTHCSLMVARADDPRQQLEAFRGSHGLLNSQDSNSGMNLFRHALAPLQQNGQFFAQVSLTGGHRDSLAAIKQRRGDLAAIDSVTFDYLARDHNEEVAGIKVIGRTAKGPCLPYITRTGADAGGIRQAMNQALKDLPDVAQVLAIAEVLPAVEEDYQVLLDYQAQAEKLGLAEIAGLQR